MDRMVAGVGLMDLEQELYRAEVESVSSDNTVASGTNGNVQVVVRVRPPSSRERDQGYLKCVGVDSAAHSVTLNFRPQPRTFTFDYVADEVIGQEEIFTAVGKPITDACLQGYHCCLIAYGQTGAGKTFTMEGPDSESSSGGSPGFLAKAHMKRHEKRGLIPRILDYIFQKMAAEKTQNCKDVEFVVKCSYLQIYNEQVSDLLDPGSYNLTIHEDAKAGMYVEGLQEVVVSTAEATYGVFRRGSENRHVGMTAMNLESSRSHSVFTVVVESQRRNDGGVMNRRTSRFYLVDLAGSERQKHSESAGIRLKEAGSINKSLSALGNVIKALVDISEGKIRHVPYRDSKLTFLLKDALGGNSKCTLIANVSPAEKNIDETLSTLKFAQRAKLIHNTAIVNEDMFGNPAVMGEEIRRLRLEIAALRANVGSGPGGDQSSIAGQEIQSESVRVSRLEHIISQSVKRSLEAERKNEMEMHALMLKLEAMQAMSERLERTLQSQKMIIRLRENTIKRLESGRPSLLVDEIVRDLQEEIEQLRKQIEHHPDVVRFKMELDLCKGTLDEYEEERKDEELPFKLAQIENLNQTYRIEFQEMVEDKAKLAKELEEVKSSRDVGVNQLTNFEEQFVLLREAVEKYRIEAAEAVHKQEKAEEKLQECTKEQDEVWRRCNLSEAQATEYAQELTALKSQAEKMKGAFNQQTKLQEEIFLELQKATDELENSKRAVAGLQARLDEANALKEQMSSQMMQAEEEKVKTIASLQQMSSQMKQAEEERVKTINTVQASLDEANALKELMLSQMKQAEEERVKIVARLQVSLDEANVQKEQLSSQMKQAVEERDKTIASLQAGLDEANAFKEQILSQMKQAEDERVKTVASLQACLDEGNALKEQILSQMKQAVEERDKTIASLQAGLDEANALKEQMSFQMNQAEEEKVKTIASLQEGLDEANALKEQLLSQMKQAEEERVKTIASLQAGLDEANVLKEEMLSQMKQAEEERVKTIASLQAGLDEANALKEEMLSQMKQAEEERVKTIASLQAGLAEANALKEEMSSQMNQAEEERVKTSRSLEEMESTCERLRVTLREKETMHADLLSRVQQADLYARLLDENLAALSLVKDEAEKSRDAAMQRNEELKKAMSELEIEKQRALDEERSLSSEKLEKLRNETEGEVQQISSILQRKLAQVEELERISTEQASVISDKESLLGVAELEAIELRHQLELFNTEVAASKLEVSNLSLRLESANAQLLSVLEDKAALQSKLTEAEQTALILSSVKSEREEADRKLLEQSKRLSEVREELEALTVENETFKSVIQDTENRLLDMSSNLETVKAEHEAFVLENRTLKTELELKTREVEAVTHQKSTLDACLCEELLRTAAADKHIKELMETVDTLRADVAAMEGLKSDLLEKMKEVELLEQHAAEQCNKVVAAENASQIAKEEYNCLLTAVKCLKDEKDLLSGKIADLEVSSTAMQGMIEQLEEEKITFQTSIASLHQENETLRIQESTLTELVQAKVEAMRIITLDLENVKSKLDSKSEELQEREAQILGQSIQIREAETAYHALETDYNRLVTTLKSLQDDKEVLSQDIARMEEASQSMEKSIQSLTEDKIALEANLGSQLEHNGKSFIPQLPTEERVKDVHMSNHVTQREVQVCIDPEVNDIDLLVSRKGNHIEVKTSPRYSDKEEDRRPQEQETDARLVAGLADITDVKSFVAGNETKLGFALEQQVQAGEQLVDLPRAKDLAVQVALLTDDCSKLREALFSESCRSSTLESQLESYRGQEADYAQIRSQNVELEKELESSLTLLEGVTTALEGKKSEGVYLPKRIADLSTERDALFRELDEVKLAKSMVETELSFTSKGLGEMCSKVRDLDGEMRLLRLRVEYALADALGNGRKLEEIDDVANKLAEAEDRFAKEKDRVYQLGTVGLGLDTPVDSAVTENRTSKYNLETLMVPTESEDLQDKLEVQVEVLKSERSRLMEELQVLQNKLRTTMSSLQDDNVAFSKEIQDLKNKLLRSQAEITLLQTCNSELRQAAEAYTSKICSLDILLRNTISDHEAERLVLERELCNKELQLNALHGQSLKYAADMQELRDEVQYNLGEVEYEFQKHVIDTEARMVDLENQKKLVESEASQSTARLSAEYSKFAAMLDTMEGQIVDHRIKVQTWVDNYNSLDSELLRLKSEVIEMEQVEARVKQLEADLVAEKKMGSEYRQELTQLRGRLSEQVKRTNPFSWNNSINNPARSESRSLQGVQNSGGMDSLLKEEFVPKFAAQQKKRMAMPSKDRPVGKPKNSYANQSSLSSLRSVTESLPPGQGSSTLASRSQSRLRNALSTVSVAQVMERSKKPTHISQTAVQTRQPLRSLSNNADDLNRHSPVVMKSRYNLRRREKVEAEPASPLELPRNNKRRRLA